MAPKILRMGPWRGEGRGWELYPEGAARPQDSLASASRRPDGPSSGAPAQNE